MFIYLYHGCPLLSFMDLFTEITTWPNPLFKMFFLVIQIESESNIHLSNATPAKMFDKKLDLHCMLTWTTTIMHADLNLPIERFPVVVGGGEKKASTRWRISLILFLWSLCQPFELELVTGVSLTHGFEWSHQCNSIGRIWLWWWWFMLAEHISRVFVDHFVR